MARFNDSPTSPDLRPVFRRHPHRVACLDAKGVVEFLQVLQRGVRADRTRRMGVDGGETLGLVLTGAVAPHLRPREEEALLRRQAVDELAFLALQRALEGLIGEADTAE